MNDWAVPHLLHRQINLQFAGMCFFAVPHIDMYSNPADSKRRHLNQRGRRGFMFYRPYVESCVLMSMSIAVQNQRCCWHFIEFPLCLGAEWRHLHQLQIRCVCEWQKAPQTSVSASGPRGFAPHRYQKHRHRRLGGRAEAAGSSFHRSSGRLRTQPKGTPRVLHVSCLRVLAMSGGLVGIASV